MNWNPDFLKLQLIFKTFLDLQKWSIKNVFTPDSAEPESWLYCSCVDNIITAMQV